MLGKKVVKKVSYVGKKARTTFSFCLFRVELDRKSNQDFFCGGNFDGYHFIQSLIV